MAKERALELWSSATGAPGQWTSNAADGSSAQLAIEPRDGGGSALRFDFTLAGHGAWVIARRDLEATLPPHYVAVLELRGAGDDPVELQLKLVDPSGANVWWWRRAGFVPGAAPSRVVLRRASLEFAWGPASGGDPKTVRAIELALASDVGATGTLWIEGLRVEPRDPEERQPRVQAARASSQAGEHVASSVLEPAPTTAWCPAQGDTAPWLELDLGRTAEWGGVVVDFAGEPVDCRLLASDDGASWTPLAESSGHGGRCWLRTADGEGRLARLEFAKGSSPRVTRADVVPLELAVSPSRYVTANARQAPRGRFPRHLLGEQAYWAIAGADGDSKKGLLGEDGALEVDAESFTLEPFLWESGKLWTWADVEKRVSLAEGHLPIPTVEWRTPELGLRVTAFAAGPAERSTLVARYEVETVGGGESSVRGARRVRLLVAVRPFQVNPSWQSLNIVGGVAPITRVECTGDTIRVNGGPRAIALSPPAAVGAASSTEGLAGLGEGRVPEAALVEDPIGFAEAAFAFDLELGSGPVVIDVVVPLHDGAAVTAPSLEEAVAYWRERLDRIPIELPRGAARMSDSLRASVAWILVNREGPRIQPGPRCYRRSWIRDGTLTGTAIAEMGFADEARAFLRWYAPFQLPDGRVPCAVDRRDVIDQAVEHDSHGQLVWGLVEMYRLTGDRGLLEELWPRARAAIGAIEKLRATRTTKEYRGNARFGLLPESISHEGYASHPVHSYWDDFFAVRALADAAEAATILGDAAEAKRFGALRDAMRNDLASSVVKTIAEHGIDFVPGSVELGDFDPTSTAIALDPCGAASLLPPAALAKTFERYWSELEARRRGDMANEAYTPYEVRTAAALVMLGHRERAAALLDWLVADQRLEPWCSWPEISWKERRAPRFFGDLPHGWVASSFVRAVRRMIAYEREDGALVVAAGLPAAWVNEEPGVRVHGLPTHWGLLDYTICAAGPDRVRVALGGSLRTPPGGIVIRSPLDRPLRSVVIDGDERPASRANEVVLHDPGVVSLLY